MEDVSEDELLHVGCGAYEDDGGWLEVAWPDRIWNPHEFTPNRSTFHRSLTQIPSHPAQHHS